jgi:tetratricopeptide (TPR) repeat protein
MSNFATEPDIALDSLPRTPEWLGRLPNVKAIRVKSQFGVAFHKPEKDWERLGIELRNQRAAAPSDLDLLVLEAKYWLHREDRDKARDLVAAALQQDNQNAEAWFMRGLDRYRSLEVSHAAIDLRRAADLAPDSPQYRSGLARTLLDMGKIDESIEEYRKVNQFPLARAEQALAHWAKGEIAEAAGAQRDATKMLRDARLGNNSYNLRMWIFQLPKKWVRLITPEDKLCYVLVGAAASNWLARPNENTFPANECSDPSSEIRELVANDLCRFVDSRRPDMAAVTEKLRGMLAQPKLCSS